jgi:hypothetical protein
VPQLGQNFAPEGVISPHEGQRCSSAVPQFMQNRAPSGLSVPQDSHLTPATRPKVAGRYSGRAGISSCGARAARAGLAWAVQSTAVGV